jgi:hypothetical protein
MDTNITRDFALRVSRSLVTRTGKSIVVVGVVSCLAVTGFAVAVTGAGAALSGQPEIVSVNRSHKSDRLLPVPKHTSTVSSPAVTTLSQPPTGCESAFSRVADPQRAHIFGRCIS